jgi:multiple sugar transport system substrate-binding protein
VLVTASALAVTGCAASDGGDSSGSGTTEISLWHYYGEPDTATGGPFYKLVEGFEAKNPDIKVKVRFIPYDDFNRTLLQSAASGDAPDVALINAFDTAAMADGGVIQDISARVKKWGEQSHYFKTGWATAQVDGKTYGIPHLADAYALYYNETLLDAAGVKPPETWDAMQSAASKLATDGHTGLAMSGIEGVEGATAPIIRLLADGGDPKRFDSAAGAATLDSFQELVDSGGLSKGFLTWNEDDVRNQFATGQAAMMINSATYVNVLRDDNPDLKWKVALLPKGTDGNKTFLSAENLTIGAGSKHADAAWKLITYMQQPKVLADYLPKRNKLPARDDVPGTADDPIRAVFADQLKSAWAPQGKLAAASNKVFTYIQKAMQAKLSGSASTKEALKTAQSSIDEALAAQ